MFSEIFAIPIITPPNTGPPKIMVSYEAKFSGGKLSAEKMSAPSSSAIHSAYCFVLPYFDI